jgi:hypothetical protein
MKPCLPRFFFLVALAFCGAAHAADVGRVLLAAGDTVAIRGGQTVKLTFSSTIQDKDVLRTGAASNLQVRFVDESIVSMKEASELRIDDFQFSGTDDGQERAFFRLLKGGLRTVTGLIGRSNHKNYQMSTTTASIGIRGTDYSLTLCQGDCRNNDGTLAKDGLYGRPNGQSQGTNKIDVFNERDQKTFGINESFYVADAKSVVEPLLVAPDFLANRLEGRKQGGNKSDSAGSGTEQATTGGAAGESRPSTTPDPLPQLQFVATQDLNAQGTVAVLPPANGFVVVFPLPGSLVGDVIFDDDRLSATGNALNQLLSFGSLGTFPAGSLNGGSITNTGSVTMPDGQVFTWGQWNGPTLVTLSDGSTFTGAPVLFGTATGLQKNSQLSFGGVATYTYAGGPKPVDAGGNLGSITSSSATIDFTQQTAQLLLNMNFPSVVAAGVNTGSATFNVSGLGNHVSSQSFSGDFVGNLSGSCTGSGCASSSASGFFGAGKDGPNGYDFSVFAGQVNGTKAGDAAFLNLYLVSSFTPGAPPSGSNSVTGQLAYTSNTPSPYSAISGFGSATLSGANLTSYGGGSGPFSGTLGSGTVIETGSIATVDGGTMNWGRWSGSGITVTDSFGSHSNPSSGVPYVYGSGNTVLPTSGTFIYNYAGGPNPVNAIGQVGTFTGGAFQVNFGAGGGTFSISTPLSLSVGGVNYSLTTCQAGCSFSGVSLGGGTPTNFTGSCSGGACSTSTPISTAGAGGIFVGPQAGGLAVSGVIGSPAPSVAYAAAFKR